MKKEKSIYNLSPGWLMHRLTMKKNNQNPKLFDEICILISRRLQEKKRFYKNPFPVGEYKLYVSLQKTTFDGVLFKHEYNDIFLLSGNRKRMVVFVIQVEGNTVEFKDLESKSPHFSPLTCKEVAIVVLKQMGFSVKN